MGTMVQHCGRRMRGVREARIRLIGRGIVIGLCALACVVALSLHTERVAAAGYTVNVTTDSGTPGDLRDAINQVNAGTGMGDTITITATGTITLTSALPGLNKNVAITGPGAAMLTVQAATTPNSATYGVFIVGSGITASISNLTIANGNAGTGGIFNNNGGGINNGGTLTVTNSTLSNNSTAGGGSGGGIFNQIGSMLTVTNCILSGNSATGSRSSGGGIFNSSSGTLTVTNSTLSANSASFGGGGIFSLGTPNLTNTIVAGNTTTGTGPDINGPVASHGHNLIGNTDGISGFTPGPGDKTGTTASPLDPQFVTPTPIDNGGTTPLPDGTHVTTQAITSASPAFHAGDPTVCTAPFPTGANSQDERGANFPRSTTACSIGAFEPQSATTTITLSPTTLPAATGDTAYPATTLTATGGTAPYTFTVTSGMLPTGLTLTTGGLLSGTPTQAGPFTFTVTAQDANGVTGMQQYTLTVTAPTITLSPTTLPGGVKGSPYPATTLTATGGTAPYIFAVTVGMLPTGLTLTPAGLLSGTPSATGPFPFTVQATDANGFTGSQQYTVTITAPIITLSPTALPNGTVGVAYNQTISASGGSGTGFTFTVTAGTLPSGLTLSPAGLLSGTPTAAVSRTFTVTATDSARNMGSQQYTLTITATAPPTLKSIALTGPNGTPPPATLKVGQTVQITATGAFSDGSMQNLNGQVVFSSSNATVVKVDTTGKVTGESPGTATITATLNGVTQSFTVTVGAPTPVGITVQPAPASRPSGVGIMPPGAPTPAAAPVGR